MGDRSPVPFMAALFNYGALILCGKVDEEPFVTWMSVAGAIVQAIYLAVFLKCSTPANRRWWLVFCVPPAIAYVVLLGFYCAGRTAHFGVVCAVSGVVQAFSPLLNVVIYSFLLPTNCRTFCIEYVCLESLYIYMHAAHHLPDHEHGAHAAVAASFGLSTEQRNLDSLCFRRHRGPYSNRCKYILHPCISPGYNNTCMHI